MGKSIEEMTHDYVVACLQSGKDESEIDVKEFISLAEEVKSKARPIDKQLAENDREDAKRGF